MLKEYTINVDGSDNGNVIPSGFKIKVTEIVNYNNGSEEEVIPQPFVQIKSCTENASGMCYNDDIPSSITYEPQPMSSNSNAILIATFEVTLDTVYGQGNWTK